MMIPMVPMKRVILIVIPMTHSIPMTGIPVVVVYAGRNRITMATIGKIVNPRVVVGQNMVRWRCSRSVPTKKPFVERRVKTLIKASRLVNTDTTHSSSFLDLLPLDGKRSVDKSLKRNIRADRGKMSLWRSTLTTLPNRNNYIQKIHIILNIRT